ncbi:proton-coupled amino acid transporter 4 [Trichinella spiralis]|uniref:proton-coupled amino acid transporter 4 n=1 Tax=Trichinella spiralis TaxID=6334 RepID=UPI0001EFCCEA|nr:proton-coupled amino acid transporter 4 [Trichinella spiralis]
MPNRNDRYCSNDQAVMSLIKALCGTGIFALPQAFRNAGLWAGIVLLLLNNTIAIFCLQILARRAQKFCLQTKQVALDYGKVVELTFANGPKSLTRFAKASRIIVNVLIGLCQFGICAAYFAFIAANLQQGFDFISDWSVHVYMAIVLPLLLLAGSLRYLKYLTILSTAANLIYVVVLSVTLYFIFQVRPDSSNLPAFQSWDTLPLAFGTIMFSFEAITVVLPVENRMKTPVDFTTWNGVLNTSCIVVTLFYIAFGFFGYIRYGDGIQDSITLNLPYDNPLCRTVKILIAIAVAFSYPLQFYVPMDLIATFIKEKFRDKQVKRMLLEYAARYGHVRRSGFFVEFDHFIGGFAYRCFTGVDYSPNFGHDQLVHQSHIEKAFHFHDDTEYSDRALRNGCSHHGHIVSQFPGPREEEDIVSTPLSRLFIRGEFFQLVHCWQTCMASEPEPPGNDCWQCVGQFHKAPSPGGHFPQSLDIGQDPAPSMLANRTVPLGAGGAPSPDRRRLRPSSRTTNYPEEYSGWMIGRHRLNHGSSVEAFDPLSSAFATADHIREINPSDNFLAEANRLLRHAARITAANVSQRRAAAAVYIQRIIGIAFRITSFSSMLQYT